MGVASLLAAGTAACRDVEAPPVYYEDLGTDGQILVPTPPVWKNAAIAKGQADWHAIPEPRVEAATEAPAEQEEKAGPGQAPGTEAEIRRMVAEYNEVAEEGSVDDLLDYFVEAQHEVLRPLFESTVTLRPAISELRKELGKRLPDAQERIEKAVGTLESGVDLRLTVDSLSVLGESEVVGRVTRHPPSSGGGVGVRFVLQDDVWYIELPQIEAFASATKTGVTVATEALNAWLEALRTGEPPEAILTQVESVASAAQGSSGTTEEGPNGDEGGP